MNKMNKIIIILLLNVMVGTSISGINELDLNATEYIFPDDTTFLKTLIKEKPHLILTNERLKYLKDLSNQDPTLKKYISQCLIDANRNLYKALPVYVYSESEAGYLLGQSWSTFDIVTNLSFAYLWTGNPKYAERAKQILLTVATFPDWNPDHFLDAAIMGTAVSLGFDWLYNFLDNASREAIKAAIKDKILIPGKTQLDENVNWQNNWSIICNSALITSSLAIAEWNKELVQKIIPVSLASLSAPLGKLAPDGAWFEGALYLKVSLDMYSYCVSSLLTALNNDLGMTNYKGLNTAGDFYIACEARDKKLFLFADIYENARRRPAPFLFFLGDLFKNERIVSSEHDFLNKETADVFHVIWYKNQNSLTNTHEGSFFRGDHEFLFFDDSTYNENSINLLLKGGQNHISHGHMDLGNFECIALGIRWARDLGADNYNIPGYADGRRYNLYRCGALSHNVPIINESNQDPFGTAKFLKLSLQKNNSYGIIDLTAAYTNRYTNYVNRLYRGIRLVDQNRGILIQDEYSLKSEYNCKWGMTTEATIKIVDSKNATLTKGGKTLYAKILSPSNAEFSIESTAPPKLPPGQNPNIGTSRLVSIVAANHNLNFTMIILLSPNWNGYKTSEAELIPLDKWE
jgi:hypothetical protein